MRDTSGRLEFRPSGFPKTTSPEAFPPWDPQRPYPPLSCAACPGCAGPRSAWLRGTPQALEATASDPAVQQQFRMIVGIPHAGQVHALATLNTRGERSVICRGDFDRHVSEGPLPPGALERAAELDAT